MKISFLAAALALLCPASGAFAVTIDFEDFAGLPTVGTGAQEGVDVAAGTDLGGLSFDADIRVGLFPFLNGPATTGYIGYKADALATPRTFDLTGTFTSLVTSLTLGAGDNCCDLENALLIAYDAFGNIVDSASFSARQSQYLTVSGDGIKSFYLSPGSGGFDNISFDIAPVPLPASLPLMLAGIGGLALVRRRRT